MRRRTSFYRLCRGKVLPKIQELPNKLTHPVMQEEVRLTDEDISFTNINHSAVTKQITHDRDKSLTPLVLPDESSNPSESVCIEPVTR